MAPYFQRPKVTSGRAADTWFRFRVMYTSHVHVVAIATCILTLLLQVTEGVYQIGHEAMWQENTDSVRKAVLLPDPGLKMKEDGILTEWNVYTDRGRRSMHAYLQVWRPLSNGRRRYRLVAETGYTALWVGHSNFILYPEDRIHVQAGDTLGIYFPKYNPIPWKQTQCKTSNLHFFKYNPQQMKVGSEYNFERANAEWKACREYSFNATVMNEREVRDFDRLQELKPDDRLARRPYGKYLPTKEGEASSSERLGGRTDWMAGSHTLVVLVLSALTLS